MKVLLTGGSGQVGSALRESASGSVVVRAPSSRELDIRNAAPVRAALNSWRPDIVINAAAYTNVERAEDETEWAMAVNGLGAGNLAMGCAETGCALIHLSTDYVFDGRQTRPYRERDAAAPLNVYGRSKLLGEQRVREHLDHHLILRVSWVFSATGSNFVKTMLGVAHLDEVRVVNDQHGTPCAAASIAAAVWRIAGRLADAPRFGTYHFASTPPTTWHEFAETIYAMRRELVPGAGTPRVVAIPTSERITRAERPMHSVLDCARLLKDYGIEAANWRDELRALMTNSFNSATATRS